jgi:hypothetical protein
MSEQIPGDIQSIRRILERAITQTLGPILRNSTALYSKLGTVHQDLDHLKILEQPLQILNSQVINWCSVEGHVLLQLIGILSHVF